MKRIFLIYIALMSTSTYAIPTIEGLFRNVSNKEVSGNLLVVTAQIEIFEQPLSENKLIVAPLVTSTEGQEENNISQPRYVKWLISLERENLIDVIQVSYKDATMKTVAPEGTRYFPDFKKMVLADNSLERSLFYSLLTVLTLNESEFMGAFMSKYAQGYVTNKELMSREKINLYYRYKEYLEKRQDDESLRSPLDPEETEKAQQVKELIDSPMYRDAGNVRLVKSNGQLAWRADLKNMQAYFSNEIHRLKQIDYQSPLGDLKLVLDDYVLFNGAHELPKNLIFKDMAQKTWRVRFTGLSHLSSRNKAFSTRAQEYADAAKSPAPAVDYIITPVPFIF